MRRTLICILTVFAIILTLSPTTVLAASKAEKTYDKAQDALIDGKYQKAADLFESISGYEDAAQYALYAKVLWYGSDGKYDDALKTLAFLGDFKDSIQLINYYTICKLSISTTIVDIIDAAEQFEDISAYRDSAQRADACRQKVYDEAIYRFGKEDYDTAKWIFEKLGKYKDSEYQLQLCKNAILEEKNADAFAAAEEYAEEHEYGKAINIFNSLSDYNNSDEKSKDVFATAVEYAQSLATEEKYVEALSVLTDIETYGDIKDERLAIKYEQAIHLMEAEEYADACLIFTDIEEYEDSSELAEICYSNMLEQVYNKATALMNNEDYQSAAVNFEAIADYKGSGELAAQCVWKYLEGESFYKEGDWNSDAFEYAALFFNRHRNQYNKMSADEIKQVIETKRMHDWYFGSRSGDFYIYRSEGKTNYQYDFETGEYREAEREALLRGYGYRYATYEWYQLSDKWFVVIRPGEDNINEYDVWVKR